MSQPISARMVGALTSSTPGRVFRSSTPSRKGARLASTSASRLAIAGADRVDLPEMQLKHEAMMLHDTAQQRLP